MNFVYIILQIIKFSKILCKKIIDMFSGQHCLSLCASVIAPGLCVPSLFALHHSYTSTHPLLHTQYFTLFSHLDLLWTARYVNVFLDFFFLFFYVQVSLLQVII